jgi:DNA-binding transcriptional LysR family regulator
MNRLHAMRVLIRVAELASFAQAAEQLGISASSVTRSISMLETDLNVLLLNRSTRKVSLTDVGREYLDSARTVIAQLDELESRLSRANREVRGTLRIVASSTFAGCGLFSLLAAYQKAHPDVCFDGLRRRLFYGMRDRRLRSCLQAVDHAKGDCRCFAIVPHETRLARHTRSTQYPSVTFGLLRCILLHMEVLGIWNVVQH